MPNASTWFPASSPDPTLPHTHTRSAAAGANNDPIDDNNDDDDDEDDLAVASERISIKCPLTLLPMKDPVTSLKCPHSFEKEAILSMLGASGVWVGGSGRRGDGQRGMKCPVCEVVRSPHLTFPSLPLSLPLSTIFLQINLTPNHQLLTAPDLAPNPVLVRKIKRLLAAQQTAQIEDFSDDDNGPKNPSSLFGGGSSRRPEEIGSSPGATRTPRLKNERSSVVPGGGNRGGGSRGVSMVPNSQVGRVGSQVVDLEGEDEDEGE